MLLELDFQDHGMDLEELLPQRSWRWFRLRCLRLIGDEDTRIHRALTRTKEDDDG
jgi:hypothetical protein